MDSKQVELKYARADYMRGDATHREYYGQFCTPEIVGYVMRQIDHEQVRLCLTTRNDPHLNEFGGLRFWDAVGAYVLGMLRPFSQARKRDGQGGWSAAELVCVCKEAARLGIEAKYGFQEVDDNE